MRTSIFFVLFILTSCGKDVNLDTTKLESVSKLSLPDQSGTLTRSSSGDMILANSKNYKVSIYSSYLALEFIAAKPLGTSMAVKFKGSPDKKYPDQIVLELIQAP